MTQFPDTHQALWWFKSFKKSAALFCDLQIRSNSIQGVGREKRSFGVSWSTEQASQKEHLDAEQESSLRMFISEIVSLIQNWTAWRTIALKECNRQSAAVRKEERDLLRMHSVNIDCKSILMISLFLMMTNLWRGWWSNVLSYRQWCVRRTAERGKMCVWHDHCREFELNLQIHAHRNALGQL